MVVHNDSLEVHICHTTELLDDIQKILKEILLCPLTRFNYILMILFIHLKDYAWNSKWEIIVGYYTGTGLACRANVTVFRLDIKLLFLLSTLMSEEELSECVCSDLFVHI